MQQAFTIAFSILVAAAATARGNWYDESFLLLHEDHHTSGSREVGRDADPAETAHAVKLLAPDVLQIHAKGNPGWTTYPSKIGHVPLKLARDVLDIYRDIARREGYHWSIYYNIGRDGELMKRHPEWNRNTKDGMEVDRALCYHSGVAEAYVLPMLSEIIAGYQPNGFWFDGSVFTIRSCYCTACRERFRRKHDAPLPVSAKAKEWPPFQEMHRRIYREFVAKVCRHIHAADPECLVTFNWAHSMRMPERPDPGIAYLTGDIANRVEGLSLEAHWYDGVGLPFDLMTTGYTYETGQGDRLRKIPKPACQIQQEMAVIIANGGRFNLWDNPTQESRIDPELFRAYASRVAEFLRPRQEWCLGSTRMPDLSVLHNAAAHYALADTGTLPFSRRNNRIEGVASILPRLHLNYEFVGDWRLEKGDVRSPLLVVEHPKRLSRRSAEALIAYIEDGGQVLLTGMGITQHRDLIWPVFGVKAVEVPHDSQTLNLEIDDGSFSLNHWLYEIACDDAEVIVAAKDPDGKLHPFLTRKRHGKGCAHYIATPFLTSHGKNTPSNGLIRVVLDEILPPSTRRLTTDAPDHVEVVLRTLGNATVAHLVNMHRGTRRLTPRKGTYDAVILDRLPQVPVCSVTVRTPSKPAHVTLQPQDVPVEDWRYEKGFVMIRVPAFDVHQMIVVEVESEER